LEAVSSPRTSQEQPSSLHAQNPPPQSVLLLPIKPMSLLHPRPHLLLLRPTQAVASTTTTSPQRLLASSSFPVPDGFGGSNAMYLSSKGLNGGSRSSMVLLLPGLLPPPQSLPSSEQAWPAGAAALLPLVLLLLPLLLLLVFVLRPLLLAFTSTMSAIS